MTEFNLGKRIISLDRLTKKFHFDRHDKNILHIQEVKEFIRLLKEKLCGCDKKGKCNHICPIINNLAGEEFCN